MEANDTRIEKSAFEKAMSVSRDTFPSDEKNGKMLIGYSFLWSLLLLAAVPFACLYSGEGADVFENFRILILSPSKLITDYFNLGSLGSTFLNAALCGFACNIIMVISKAVPSSNLLAGYFLVIAHCFYGLNIINMWPPFIGIFVFSLVRREKFGNILSIAMFSTSLAPFISDFLFRYTLADSFDPDNPKVTFWGILLSAVFGLIAGFLIPALLPGTTKMHRGFNLFKAGLAIGLFGMFANALFYKTFGIEVPDTVIRDNPLYTDSGEGYILFVDIFYMIVFGITFLIGFVGNGKSIRGYRSLLRCDGWQDDFPVRFGIPLTFINIGIYGFTILAYLNLAFLLTDGVGFSAPTVGVTIAAITFSASGQTPKNVWPVTLGYVLLYAVTGGICMLVGISGIWTITTQGYINGLAFATGLCPFAGRYGKRVGIAAGMLHAILCTSTSAMHGGFVLYNGGLTSGLTALLLLPILDFYRIGPKKTEDDL